MLFQRANSPQRAEFRCELKAPPQAAANATGERAVPILAIDDRR